jgi:hypothetical protein
MNNEQYRRDILSCLFEDGDFVMNEIALLTALRFLGNPIARDGLKTQLQWLKEQDLIALTEIKDVSMNLAKLTAHGADVAEGLANAPGVARMPL